MAESMACGTPIIAFDRGLVREVVKDGKTGFVVKPFNGRGKVNIEGFVEAVKKINQIKRADCREWVEKNFSLERMVDDYEKLFYKILNSRKQKP